MPGLNGFQATRAITREEKTKHIPVIICTTKDQETDKIWGLRQGAKDYVTKPRRTRPTCSRRSRRWAKATMARRTGLREFQLSVAERLRTAATRAALSSKLGFQVGADNWFVALHQVSEVIPVPAIGAGAAHAAVVPRRGQHARQPVQRRRFLAPSRAASRSPAAWSGA